MANILEMIVKSQNGALVKEIGQQHGLEPNQALDAIRSLLPSLTKGMKDNMQKEGGLGSLLDALNKGNHQKYIDNPREIVSQAAVDDGNSILGHIFGSKDRSREVAREASQKTGIDFEILKKILPQVAGASMGGMSKRVNTRESGGLMDALNKASQQAGQGNNDLSSILGKVLGGQRPSAPVAKRGGLGGMLGNIFGKKKAAPSPTPQMPDLGGLLGGLLGGKSAKQLPPQVQDQTRSILEKMLDQDGDGNVLDDVMGMAKKFL